ncbi:MAG TPA: inosine/xanthosine triphosphatase [bacterium]|nr:inosine/xanthosine triphosphatase [bacterium]
MKRFAIGSRNAGKIQAVCNALGHYDDFREATVSGFDVPSGVSAQPVGLDEIITGAINRAKAAYESGDMDLGFGLESGIFPAPYAKSGYYDTTCCAIYDGTRFHTGLSGCFEYPKVLVDKLLNEGREVSDVAIELGFSEDPKFREGLGMIGTLTQGIVTRVDYSEQAVHMALVHLLNPKHY